MALPTGYYIIKGFVSKAELLLSGVNIKSLPVQSDQSRGRLWIRPGDEADVVKPSSLVDNLSGRRFPYGGAQFKWPMMNLSPKMVRYLHETYFEFNWYAELTVQTFNRASGDWECYLVTARWPDYSAEAEMAAGGYNKFQINFVNCITAPDGPNLILDGEASGNFIIGAAGTFTMTVGNIGDADTFDTTYVNYHLPDAFVFQSYVLGTGWDLLWSSDGITYNDVVLSPPSSTDVHYLRWVHEGVIEDGENASSFSVTLRPDEGGDISNVFIATTAGDVDEGDNEFEFLTIVQGSPFRSGFNVGFGLSERGFSTGFEHPPFGISRTGFSSGFSNGFASG